MQYVGGVPPRGFVRLVVGGQSGWGDARRFEVVGVVCDLDADTPRRFLTGKEAEVPPPSFDDDDEVWFRRAVRETNWRLRLAEASTRALRRLFWTFEIERRLRPAPPSLAMSVLSAYQTDELLRDAERRLKARAHLSRVVHAKPIAPHFAAEVPAPSSSRRGIDDLVFVPAAPSPRSYIEDVDGTIRTTRPDDLSMEDLCRVLRAYGSPHWPDEAFVWRALDLHRDGPHELIVSRAVLGAGAPLPARMIGMCARAYFRAGLAAEAAGLLSNVTDPDERVLAADIAKDRGRDEEAIRRASSALQKKLDVLGGDERVRRWRRALRGADDLPRILHVRWFGAPWTLSFNTRPTLGRVDADVVVPSPLVSRRHLVFTYVEGVAAIEDLDSKHGSFIARARLRGAFPVAGPTTFGSEGQSHASSDPQRATRATRRSWSR